MRFVSVAVIALATSVSVAAAQDFQIEDVSPGVGLDAARLKPHTIVFSDHLNNEVADPATGLIRFDDWARTSPVQRQFLSLYPGYSEPTVAVSEHGVTKPAKRRLHMYVAAARFVLDKASSAIDLSRYVTVPFLEMIDPAIKQTVISPSDVKPLTDAAASANRNPERPWCDDKPNTTCLQSHYQLEGQLPLAIRLVNKLREGSKKPIADYLEFQSEIRLQPAEQVDQAGLAKLTAVDTPIAQVLEQSIFYVNQVMQFGKFIAVFQPHPSDPAKTVVSVFMALAIESDVLEKKKEFENIPILRNLVPAQVLVGRSSFNTGKSLSAGLPDYTRNRIKAIAGLLARG